MNRLLVFQSGGPTAVLNASLTGIILEARKRSDSVLGSRRGLQGVATGGLVELSTLSDSALERLRRTPSAGLGTSRFRPDHGELLHIVQRLHDLDVRGVIAIGGNDTADTAKRLEREARNSGYDLSVISIPKTIDNDLAATDHSLGFPSAARCMASVTRDACIDSMATATLYPVKIIEVMGRNAGWLAASCSLAIRDSLPPPLTILPECPFASVDALLQAIQLRIEREEFALIVVPETARWADGSHFGGPTPEWVDAFGHPYFPSAGQALLELCSRGLGLRCKLDRPGSFSRAAMDFVSPIDLDEAERCGARAVKAISDGESGKCVIIQRRSDSPYASELALAPLEAIANVERLMPAEMLGSAGEAPGEAFRDYALPLIGDPFPAYEVLQWT